MYKLKLRTAFESAHQLTNPFTEKCKNLHGHNWKVDIEIWKKELSERQMVVDFTEIKNIIKELDHKFLNDIIENPTAERISKFIYDKINELDVFEKVKIKVLENDNSSITYEN